MDQLEYTETTTAAAAVLSICESLIALSDLNIIGKSETLAVLEDAAAAHRNAIAGSPYPDEHRAVAALIQRIIDDRGLDARP